MPSPLSAALRARVVLLVPSNWSVWPPFVTVLIVCRERIMGRIVIAVQRLACVSSLQAAAVPGALWGNRAVATGCAALEEEAPPCIRCSRILQASVACDVR